MASLRESVLRRKPVVEMEAESGSETDTSELSRSIGLFQLSMFGVGATIGTGIFFVLSQAVPVAGPAVIISFVIAGTVAGLTAICYAELAGAVPVSGSSYSYAYATLGELLAMAVAACLLLEYGVSGAAVAVGWSQYLNELLDNLFGVQIPDALSQAPGAGRACSTCRRSSSILLCTLLLIRGASESATINADDGDDQAGRARSCSWSSGSAAGTPTTCQDFAPFGLHGITSAAGIIFFSYIGLDAVSTAGEEVKDPHRTMPLAILDRPRRGHHGLHPGHRRGGGRAAARSVQGPGGRPVGDPGGRHGVDLAGAASSRPVRSISIFSVTLVVIYGQTRILFAMARDGMLPELFHKVNPRTLTPVPNTIIVATVIALLAGLIPINFLRRDDEHRHPRRVPGGLDRCHRAPAHSTPTCPAASRCLATRSRRSCRSSAASGSSRTCARSPSTCSSSGWRVAMVWYFAYGIKHSHLGRHERVGLVHGRPHAMTYVVGQAPDQQGKDGAAPRGTARAVGVRGPHRLRSRAPTLVPEHGQGRRRVPGVPQQPGRRGAGAALCDLLPGDVRATALRHAARSAPAGLLEIAERHDAGLIVLGSSSAGAFGHVALGSVTDRLLHSSHLPVAVATRGYRAKPGQRVRARHCRLRRLRGSRRAGRRCCHRRGQGRCLAAPGRVRGVVSTGVHDQARHRRRGRRPGRLARRGPLGDGGGAGAGPAAAGRAARPAGGGGHRCRAGPEAIDDVEWEDGDVLVVGSSAVGPIARVFLGSRATKIVRHSPVPVVVVPRAAVEELADSEPLLA